MTAVFLKLAEARESLGNRFGWEVAGIPAAFVVFIGAIALTGTALSPSVEPVPVSMASPLQSLSQGEQS